MINLRQKAGFKNKTMKPFLLTLLIAICFAQFAAAQTIATKSYPFSVGTISCGSGTQQIQFFNYNGTTNIIQNATGGLVNPCIPQLRTGLPIGGTQRFTSSLASVSFNLKIIKHIICGQLMYHPPKPMPGAGLWAHAPVQLQIN